METGLIVLSLIAVFQGQQPWTLGVNQPSMEVCLKEAKKFLSATAPAGLQFRGAGCSQKLKVDKEKDEKKDEKDE
jgi:hypothetical protein